VTRLRVGLLFTPLSLSVPEEHGDLQSLDVMVFPELVDGGYATLADGGGIHRRGDALWELFRVASRSARCTVIGGSMVVAGRAGRRTNMSPVFARGRFVHHYEKIHVFRPAGDHRYFERGRHIRTFTVCSATGNVKGGIVLCFDLRFPELIRAMALDGMQVLFVPSRWPVERDRAWRTLLRARAIENQIFVVGCNAPDAEGGHSYVFDPSGELLLSTEELPRASRHTVTLDIGRIAEAHRLYRNLKEAVLLRYATLPRTLPPASGPFPRSARRRSAGR
jgi:omega-amidase